MITQMQIIFFLLAGLFGTLFLIFVYYLYNEKLVTNQYQGEMPSFSASMDKLAPESVASANNVSANLSSGSGSLSPAPVPTQQVPKNPQVFNVSQNKYTYPEARALCKVFDSDLATLEQLIGAYREGADWCNYGWVDGQMAFYPTQKTTWDKLQKNSTPERKNACGKPGLNGGYFNNPDLRFGVTCYGIKPEPRAHERVKSTLTSDEDNELQKMIDKFRKDVDNITILPFNRDKWGGCPA